MSEKQQTAKLEEIYKKYEGSLGKEAGPCEDFIKDIKQMIDVDEIDSIFKDVTSCFRDFKDFQNKLDKEDCDSTKDLKGALTAWSKYKTNETSTRYWDCDGHRLEICEEGDDEHAVLINNNIFCKIKSSNGPVASLKLYSLLWNDVMSSLGNRLSADTMNSFQTTYTEVCKQIGNKFCFCQKDNSESVRGQVQLFAYLTSTIGNFIPCPKGFNSGRQRSTHDYWDLTLRFIQDWYSGELKHEKFSTMLNGVLQQEEDKDNEFEWLGKRDSTGWEQFIRQNYLQDYVDANYNVTPFYENHRVDPETLNLQYSGQNQLPSNDKDILDCLVSMNSRIIARGLRMRKALLDLEKPANKDRWELLFNSDCDWKKIPREETTPSAS